MELPFRSLFSGRAVGKGTEQNRLGPRMREIEFTDTQRLFCQGAAGLRVRKPLYGIEQFPFIFSRDDLCYPRMLPSPLDGSAILGTADQQRKPHFSVVSKLARKANPHIHVSVESHGHI